MKRAPLWSVLVNRGIFEDRKSATGWIMAGKVIVGDQRALTAGELVANDAVIRVKGLGSRYVGKGGLKLEAALADFQLNVQGLTALDTGASTGGFTDCLLQHGASKVYAVDVGFGQLAGKLRADARVVNMEAMNIGDVAKQALQPPPSFATVDLSYLSLKQAIPIIARLLDGPHAQMLCLVKPLFEVEDAQARRSGVIEDAGLYVRVLEDLVTYASDHGLRVEGVTHSHVTGNHGTREFFLLLSTGQSTFTRDFRDEITLAVHRALELSEYQSDTDVEVDISTTKE